MKEPYPLLSRVNHPDDLKALPESELADLAAEIRDYIIKVVSCNGGHLASNLGVVELTIALHRVFSSPKDKIVWDVGHQCYTHKILTGRRDLFPTIRLFGGLSGFPKPSESPHDIVETGHSSTSISEALGLLVGERLQDRGGKIVAVIGDGALTGGIALEGLNQVGHMARDLVLVVNDNAMSINKNVGAIASYLSRLTTTSLYQNVKRLVDSTIKRIPVVGEDLKYLMQQLEKGARAVILPETLFSDFGFLYVGPIDGHNMAQLTHVLRNARRLDKPVVVHVKTVKGKGYAPAEQDPANYHGVSAFSVVDGKLEKKQNLTYTEAFSEALVDMAGRDDRIVAISAAMTASTGLSPFQARFPDRFFDVGITEQHAVAYAAGFARSGLRPVVAVYSTFMQRAIDQVIHDLALPRLPVVLAMDRAGLVGEDGETHHGVFDIGLLRTVPGLTIMAPASRNELRLMLEYALQRGAPAAIRYPKCPCGTEHEPLSRPLAAGRGVFVRRTESPGDYPAGKVLFLSVGGILPLVWRAAEMLEEKGIAADIYNVRFVKPVDAEHLAGAAAGYDRIVVVEEGTVACGFGEHAAYVLRQAGSAAPCETLGVPDSFVSHGSRDELLALCGLDAPSIARHVERACAEETAGTPSKIRIFRARSG